MRIPAVTGVVSEGTLRDEDLIEAFEDTLKQLSLATYRATRRERKHAAESGEAFTEAEYVEYLTNQIESCLPAGWWFGAAEGDGSCFGVWPLEPELGTVERIRADITKLKRISPASHMLLVDQNAELLDSLDALDSTDDVDLSWLQGRVNQLLTQAEA